MIVAIVGSYTGNGNKYQITYRGGRLQCSCPAARRRMFTNCKHVLDTIAAIKNATITGAFEWPSGSFEVTDEGRSYFKLSDNTGI